MHKFAALAALALACSGDKTDTTDSSATSPPVEPPADFLAFIEAYITVQCEKLFECASDTTLSTSYGFASVESCIDYLLGTTTTPTTTTYTTTYTIDDYCPYYDGDAAQACLDSFAALECSDVFPTATTTPTTTTSRYSTPECNLVAICGVDY
jgi:hypothetical protein